MSQFEERLAEVVHNAWLKQKKEQGYHSPLDCPYKLGTRFKYLKYCDMCHVDMYPYADIEERAKELDRASVKAVLDALHEVGYEVLQTTWAGDPVDC